MPNQINRRKQTIIDFDLQFKVVFVAVLAACLVLLIYFQLSLAAVWSVSETIAKRDSVELVVAELRNRVFREFAISVALGVPVAAAAGILYSFKFCGPLFRIKQHLEQLIKGTWRRPCVLRKGDDLRDVARMINESATVACDYADDAHDLLREVRDVLDELEAPEDEAVSERLSRIRERIAREEETYAKHFGVLVETSEALAETAQA